MRFLLYVSNLWHQHALHHAATYDPLKLQVILALLMT